MKKLSKWRYIMNIRIVVLSFVLGISTPLFSMQNSYSLKDALELAHNLGVRQDDLDYITHALLRLAPKDQDSIVIDRDAVHETIANVLQERITIDTLPRGIESQRVEMSKDSDPFDEEFDRGLAELATKKIIACEYEQQGNQDKLIIASQELSALHTALENKCINRSSNKWFLTGNLLFKKLRLAELQTINSEKGVIIPVVMNSQSPVYQLVSHQQVHSSCGFNALSNACAIQQQVRDGSPITSEQTRALAEFCFADTVHSSGIFKSLLFEDGIHLADGQHIEKASKDIEKKYHMRLHQIYLSTSELSAFQDETTMQPMIALLSDNPVVHFFVNIGGHWVLISVVHEQQGYVLYYLNSTNDPIKEGQLESIIFYIEELVLRAQDQ